MTTPAWPSTLPQAPLRQGYTRSSGDGVLRTPMEAGAPKARRRYTAVHGSMSCAFALSQAQLQTFKAWWSTSIAYGALSFTMPDPEAPGETITVRPSGDYKTAPRSPGRWTVSLDLTVMP